MRRLSGTKYLEKAIKGMEKLLKDLEKGRFERYGLMNPEEAQAFAQYIREKIEQYRKLLERAKSR